MKFGRFDDERREYVITRPDTPLPWINYLGSEDYLGIISNTAGGYSFYQDARLRRLTRYRYNNAPLDVGGRYVYVRDDDSGAYWSPSWQPVGAEVEDQGILGIRPEHTGLRVNPALPADWDGFSVTRSFRGTEYRIKVEKPVGVTGRVTSLEIDGQPIEGNLIPLATEPASVVAVTARIAGD